MRPLPHVLRSLTQLSALISSCYFTRHDFLRSDALMATSSSALALAIAGTGDQAPANASLEAGALQLADHTCGPEQSTASCGGEVRADSIARSNMIGPPTTCLGCTGATSAVLCTGAVHPRRVGGHDEYVSRTTRF